MTQIPIQLIELIHHLHSARNARQLSAAIREELLPALKLDTALVGMQEKHLYCDVADYSSVSFVCADRAHSCDCPLENETDHAEGTRADRLRPIQRSGFGYLPSLGVVCPRSSHKSATVRFTSDDGNVFFVLFRYDGEIPPEEKALLTAISPLLLDAAQHVFQSQSMGSTKALLGVFEQTQSPLWIVVDRRQHVHAISDEARSLLDNAETENAPPTWMASLIHRFVTTEKALRRPEGSFAFPPQRIGEHFYEIRIHPVVCAEFPELGDLLLVTLAEKSLEGRPHAATRESAPLSFRETQIYLLVLDAKTNEEIADLLHISPHTVATHIKHICRKMGARGKNELRDRNRPCVRPYSASGLSGF